ncbi:MAG: phosphopantetheine-binding protein [Christensenellales bacterium]|jgi:D-alanine--poly(phosphoribitol) ligase subunit 2
MEQLLGILTDIRPDIDFENNKELIDSGEIDSFDIVMLVGELNSAFDISIPIVSIVPENFNSVEAMMALINQLKQEDA